MLEIKFETYPFAIFFTLHYILSRYDISLLFFQAGSWLTVQDTPTAWHGAPLPVSKKWEKT